jgi:hypothetical protein
MAEVVEADLGHARPQDPDVERVPDGSVVEGSVLASWRPTAQVAGLGNAGSVLLLATATPNLVPEP